MKSKTLVIVDQYGEPVENTVFKIGRIDLGNNFTYHHFFDELKECQRDFIRSVVSSLDLSGNARIRCIGNYGTIKLDVSVYDIYDFLK